MFKQKTESCVSACLVGSEKGIRDRPYRDPRIEENTLAGERVWKSVNKVEEMSRGPTSRKLSQKHSNSQPPVKKLKHRQLDVFHPFSNIPDSYTQLTLPTTSSV